MASETHFRPRLESEPQSVAPTPYHSALTITCLGLRSSRRGSRQLAMSTSAATA
mgnify:CR=1 FL=1